MDEDRGREELLYVYQLMQEYFAARQLATDPDPALVRVTTDADIAILVHPGAATYFQSLPPPEAADQ